MTIIDSRNASRDRTGQLPPSMIERMTLVLDAFDSRAARLSLEEVARRSRLPRSTVHRILHQMVRSQWIEHASFGYRLGRRALGLGGGDGGLGEIRAAAAPILHDLHLRTGLVAHLTALDGGDVIYLDKVGGQLAARVPSRVGGRVPAYSTAGGRSVLAWLDPEQVDGFYGWSPHDRADGGFAHCLALHNELNRIRRRSGLAFERDDTATGFACVGAAVRGPDGPVAGLSLCGEAGTAPLGRVAPLVTEAARQVSRTIYGEAG